MATKSLKMTGIGLRDDHLDDFLIHQPKVAWVEVDTESFFTDGGKRKQQLLALREHYPISLHGKGLSLASADELNWQHLAKLRELSLQIDACLISDHLAWSSINGHYLHECLPFPYTDDMLEHIVTRINHVQTYLGRKILIENCPAYLHFNTATMHEAAFLNEVAKRTQCDIVLDLTSLYVSAMNLNFNPLHYLRTFSSQHVQELHISGFKTANINEEPCLIASKDQPILPSVWSLYSEAIKQFGAKPTIIEWDHALPSLTTLIAEADHAETLMRETYVAAKLAG
ncbi:MAG TPA: DUF692 domain-containing protein [Gammaproteobacteria bacterium]|jgi:uncharacterized protein (UPF0276 family)|nr:DUF692 domain-containing protein [Gammaproteobacteria bacterium]